MRKNDFFGKYGKILKLQVSVNRNGSSSYAGRNADDTGSAYVTFYEENDAMQCIQHIDGTPLDGRILRACFGTTKYCNAFLKYQPCNNPDCLYLHDIGRDNDSFTKEEMLAHYGTKHQSFQEATRVASETGGPTLERVSSLSSIPVPLPTGGARVPQPRVAPPAPPAGPPPPSAIGVGVPVASAWPSLGSSKAPPPPPPPAAAAARRRERGDGVRGAKGGIHSRAARPRAAHGRRVPCASDGVRRRGMGTGEPVSRRVRRPFRGVASERVEPERWCVELKLTPPRRRRRRTASRYRSRVKSRARPPGRVGRRRRRLRRATATRARKRRDRRATGRQGTLFRTRYLRMRSIRA